MSHLFDLVLHSFSLEDLKDTCRAFNLKGFSRFKKAELVPFIRTSLSEEEMSKLLASEGRKAITKVIELGAAIATGKEIREKLEEVSETEEKFNLFFRGMQWTQDTTIKPPQGGSGIPIWTCTCRIAQDGGACAHFYVACSVLNQFKDWVWNNLPPPLLPEEAGNGFSSFQAAKLLKKGGGPAADFKTPEEILRGFFLEYGANDVKAMERRSKDELIAFARHIASDVAVDPKWTKSRVIALLTEKFGEKELEAKFRDYRKQQKWAQAEEYLVDIKEVAWEPKERVVANLQRMESHDIAIEGTRVKHECDGWRNIRPKFCLHMLALFLELAKRDPSQTLAWLKKIAKT